MEQDSALSPVIRLLLIGKAAAVAALVAYGSDLRALDIAMWAVLVGIGAAVLLSLAAPARRTVEPALRASATVVLPDRSSAMTSAPDPAVQARAAAVDDVRTQLLEARQRGADLPELLNLSDALHEAELDLARATLGAGGWVEPALRHELALRDRSASLIEQPEQPTR